MNETSELSYKDPSFLNTVSYGLASFWSMLSYSVFNAYIIFFYEAVVGLQTELMFIAMLCFTLWDAFNDPLLGFLTDRVTKFTRKIGKRFIWIVIGIIPANFVLVLIFMPPAGDSTAIFWWVVFTTILFDSLYSLCFVNVNSLFPDKFQSNRARRRGSGISTFFSMLALPLANMIPPLLLGVFGGVDVEGAYIPMIWIMVGTLLPVAFLFLPGMWENKGLIDRYYVSKEKPEGFVSALKSTLKQRSFVFYVILFFGFQIVTGSLTASIPYAANFVLPGPPLGTETNMILLFATFLTASLISIPIWIRITKKVKNNKKMAIIGGICLAPATFITPLFTGLIDSLVYLTILGFAMGNYWALFTIYFADVLDERVILTGSPNRGTTVGVSAFLSRFARAAQIGIFAIVHILTNFVEGGKTQTLEAQFGIRLHMGIIPAIILAICLVIYWKFYPITPEVWMENKRKLKELGF
jgi:GPH family glycoside/pentoside/hexuronide:cation symporter